MTDDAVAVVVPLELVHNLLSHLDRYIDQCEVIDVPTRGARADRDWLNALPESTVSGIWSP